MLVPSLNFKTCEMYGSYASHYFLKTQNFWAYFGLSAGEFLGATISSNLPGNVIFRVPSKIFRGDRALTPLAGIIGFSILSMKMYAVSPSILVRGAVIGFHAMAMKIFAFDPNNKHKNTGLSLHQKWNIILDRPKGSFERLKKIKAEQVAGFVFVLSMIVFTCLTQNTIVAQTFSYSISAVVQPIAMRIFRNYPSLVNNEG